MMRRLSNQHAWRGLSLLEVLLALAILGGALAIIGELMSVGARSAELARDLTTAQLLSESKMAELEMGLLPLQTMNATPFEDVQYQTDWLYSINIQQIDQNGLVAALVVVEQNPDVFSRPAKFQLYRWLTDPLATSTGSTSTTSSTTGSTSGE